MMLHQDGSRFAWLDGQPDLDLIVTMDDATSEIYSAFLVEEEGTASTFRALLEVFTKHGLPSSLYTDRGSHYFLTPNAGEDLDKERLTQVDGHSRSSVSSTFRPIRRRRVVAANALSAPCKAWAGRDEETVPRSNKETEQARGDTGSGMKLHPPGRPPLPNRPRVENHEADK
jgi:hypothetical protein